MACYAIRGRGTKIVFKKAGICEIALVGIERIPPFTTILSKRALSGGIPNNVSYESTWGIEKAGKKEGVMGGSAAFE